jgi:sulfide:quinone oxidoreductase
MSRNRKTRVLIAGGGVAALEAALALRALAEAEVSVELLAPDPRFWYRPLAVAAPFRRGEVRHFELDGLTRAIGVGFTPGALVAVEEWRHIAHTSLNTEIEYDKLLIACGAVPTPAVAEAITFRGPADIEKVERLLVEIEDGNVHSVAFTIPWGASWSLPAYELALLTATHLEERGLHAELVVVTPEREPLQLFGAPASDAVRALLDARGIGLHTDAYASEFVDGTLRLIPDGVVPADRVVALPRLRGAPIDGLPQTVDGFIPVDAHCRVEAVKDVFAAGDITSFTVKQGGIATQQAVAAAEAIAAEAGAHVTPHRFRPVLRGLLLTGTEPRYLRRELTALPGHDPVEGVEPLWWPPTKIVGRYLAPFLASIGGVEIPAELPPFPAETLEVEVELDPETIGTLAPIHLPLEAFAAGSAETVDQIVLRDPLLVEPEDTIGEVAEGLLARNATAALVCEYGNLIGILTTGDLLRASAARIHPSEARARQWMTADPVAVAPGTAIEAAATLMREYGIHHLVVVGDGRPLGILQLDEALRNARLPVGLGF